MKYEAFHPSRGSHVGSGVTFGGGGSDLWRFSQGKFLLTYREEENKANCKREGGKLQMLGKKVWKWAHDLLCLFCFVCFVKFVLGVPEINFYQIKLSTSRREKIGKVTLPPPPFLLRNCTFDVNYNLNYFINLRVTTLYDTRVVTPTQLSVDCT